MLRGLAFVLLSLPLFAGSAAARGDGPAHGGNRRAEAKAAAVGFKVERSSLLRRVAAVRPAAPRAAAGCAQRARRGGGAPRCRGAAAQAVNWGGGWAQGLPPALGVQAQECPAGTMATLAEGHDDIVRCIPI